jgi:hypothetical protein
MVLAVWAALTAWLLYVTFLYAPLVPFHPTCRAEDGRMETLSGHFDDAYTTELDLYFSPFGWGYIYNEHGKGKWFWEGTEYFVTPWDTLDLDGQTSRATLSAAYSIWYGLSDEDRKKAPRPGAPGRSECDVVKLFAMRDADRSWRQCVYDCDREE